MIKKFFLSLFLIFAFVGTCYAVTPMQMGVYSSVIGAAPYHITAPGIAGTNEVGETLTVSGYDFDGETSVVIDWFGDDVSLSSAGTTYVILPADAGKIIFASVTAFNANGDTSLVSNTMTIKPYNSAAPTISGTEQVGETLTCNNGTWTGADSHAYRWINNTDGTISGATSQTYTATSGDEGDTLYCDVAGVNGGGTTSYVASGNTSTIISDISAPSYDCIEVLFEPNTAWVGVQDVGILVDGDTGTDLVASMASVSGPVTGCGDLSADEYGTSSTFHSEEDASWNDSFWTDWASTSEPNTSTPQWNSMNTDMSLFFKFPSSSQLTQVHFRLKNIPAYNEPTITFKDSSGTTITPSSSTNDGNTDRNYKFEF